MQAECEHCAYAALTYIVFAYAIPEGKGEGVLRFARIWGQILNVHISKTVRDNPIIMVHFFD